MQTIHSALIESNFNLKSFVYILDNTFYRRYIIMFCIYYSYILLLVKAYANIVTYSNDIRPNYYKCIY